MQNLLGVQLAVEMLARGLSVRDIEDAFRADDGRLLLSRTAVSELDTRKNLPRRAWV